MWVRFYDNMNPYWRQCWGNRYFDTLESAVSFGEPRSFTKVNDNAYISEPDNTGTVVKILREGD